MEVVPCAGLEAGKVVKIGDVLIVGTKVIIGDITHNINKTLLLDNDKKAV